MLYFGFDRDEAESAVALERGEPRGCDRPISVAED